MLHLVCTLGESPIPPLIARRWVEQQKGTEPLVHLFTSNALANNEKHKKLKEKVLAQQRYYYSANVDRNFQEAKRKLSEIVERVSRENAEIVIDVTGGTKIMSLAAYEVAKELRQSKPDSKIEIQYINGQSSTVVTINPESLEAHSLPYDLEQLVTLDEWVGLLTNYRRIDLPGNDSSIPKWLRDWSRTAGAMSLKDKSDIVVSYNNGFKIPFWSFLRYKDARLQLVFGLHDAHWFELAKKRLNGDERLVRRVGRLAYELGQDFCETVLVVPPLSLERQGELIKRATLTDAIRQAFSLNLQVKEWDETRDKPFEIETAPDSQLIDVAVPAPTPPASKLPVTHSDCALVCLLGDEPTPILVALRHLKWDQQIYIVTSRDKYDKYLRLEKFLGSSYQLNLLLLGNPDNFDTIEKDMQQIQGNVYLLTTGGTTLMVLAANSSFEKRKSLKERIYTYANSIEVF